MATLELRLMAPAGSWSLRVGGRASEQPSTMTLRRRSACEALAGATKGLHLLLAFLWQSVSVTNAIFFDILFTMTYTGTGPYSLRFEKKGHAKPTK